MKYLIAALILCLAIMPAKAATELDYTAIELLDMCKSSYDTDYGYCAGYALAISNVMSQGATIGGYKACGHAPVKSQQLIEIYVRYTEKNPAIKSKDAMTSVAAAISSAFPCR